MYIDHRIVRNMVLPIVKSRKFEVTDNDCCGVVSESELFCSKWVNVGDCACICAENN